MLLSAAGMSLVGLFGKFAIEDLTVPALMFWRYASTSVLLFLSLLFLGQLKGLLDFQHIKIQLLRAFFLLLAQYCFFYYLLRSNLLNASALLNTGPVFIAIIEAGVLRKKVGVSTWIAGVVSLIGAFLLLQPDAGIFSYLSLIGLLSGISQGASQVIFGMQSERKDPPHIGVMQLFSLCTVFSAIVFLCFPKGMASDKIFTSWDFGLIAALAAASILNQLFRAEAYAHGTPSRLSPFLYFAVLLAGVWDWVIFNDTPNLLSICGAALIVLGGLLKIYLRNWILNRRP